MLLLSSRSVLDFAEIELSLLHLQDISSFPPHRITSYTISLCNIHFSVSGGTADGQWDQNNQEAFNEDQSKKYSYLRS